MGGRAATLDDLHAGAYVADTLAHALYEVLDRRTHREDPKAEPVEQVRISDAADAVEEEQDDTSPITPKWIPADELVGMELVREPPQRPAGSRQTLAKLS